MSILTTTAFHPFPVVSVRIYDASTGRAATAPIVDVRDHLHNVQMLTIWLLIALVPPFVGYFLGKVWGKLRLALLASFLAAPPLIVTIFFATAEPSPGGFFLWWSIGMGIILVPEVIWATGTPVGFAIGKQNIR